LRDYQKSPLQVLSFGGGVQSTAMVLLIKEGKLPKPDLIIHSDTGSEMPHTEPIIKAIENISNELNIPFKIVKSHRGRLHQDYINRSTVPVVGIRSCTLNFKVFPQRREIRKIVGNNKGVLLAECWLGITTDEEKRRIDSDLKWIGNKFPLLDDYRLSRKDCLEICIKHNLNVKKSGCFCCPYQGKKGFINLYRNHPDLFDICLTMEKNYQNRFKVKKSLTPNLSTLKDLQISDLFTFGGEIIQEDESNCNSGGCFL
jgi:3'-phosphoadenosine 5'-phosphosulfate sulfotransferase (PAPS reductase)/FAD synthetase